MSNKSKQAKLLDFFSCSTSSSNTADTVVPTQITALPAHENVNDECSSSDLISANAAKVSSST